jgi:hypothetical protein
MADEDDLDRARRGDHPVAASSPAALVPLPVAPASEAAVAISAGASGTVPPASSTFDSWPRTAILRKSARAEAAPVEPLPDDRTDRWAGVARARTSAFSGAIARPQPLPHGGADSPRSAQRSERPGRRRRAGAAITGGMVAAAAVVVYIAMGQRRADAPLHTATGDAGQGAGDRALLSADDIERGMAEVSGKVRACFAAAHGSAALRLAVAPSGRVVSAVVTGALAGTTGARCATAAVRAVAFPAWNGAPQIVEYRVPLE